jgi:hypothetical protein
VSVSEKTEPESINAPMDERSTPPRKAKPRETLTVPYQSAMQFLVLLSPLLLFLPFFDFFFNSEFFVLEMISFGALVYWARVMADCLFTRGFVFCPDKIVKDGLFSRAEMAASSLLMFEKDGDIRFLHASEKNLRESMKIRRFLIKRADFDSIVRYAEDVYQVVPNEAAATEGGTLSAVTNQLAVMEYEHAAASYRTMAAFFVVFLVIALFAVGFSDTFAGFAPTLPAYPVRLGCIVLAISSFFLLRFWAQAASVRSSVALDPIMTRLDRAEGYAFKSAAVAVFVGALGLLLFLLFGNTLDLYLFILVGVLYFYDCYPRLSTWEELTASGPEHERVKQPESVLPRRSLQVSLVLMGALAVMSYGETSHYLYASRKDCQDDWGDSACREEPSGGGGGGGYHGGGRYYGPRYGSGGGTATHAVGVGTITRGGFGSMGSFHASFGG